jgi:hypothetical protein
MWNFFEISIKNVIYLIRQLDLNLRPIKESKINHD